MTRREKLIASTGLTLIQIADHLGVKVSCNKTRTQLKESKAGVVDRILEAEEGKIPRLPVLAEDEIEDLKKEFTEAEIGEIVELIGKGYTADDAIEEVSLRHPCLEDPIEDHTPAELEETETPITDGEDQIETPKKKRKRKSKDSTPTPAPGRGAQIEYDGRSQNICAWAKELGISANTLYARIYHSGWTVEEAFTTPSKGRGHRK